MSRRKFETPATGSSDLTSTGMPWSEVPTSRVPIPMAGWTSRPGEGYSASCRSVPYPRSAFSPSCFAC